LKLAIARITLDFYNNTKVAEKTRLLESLCKELRTQYNISCLEIDEQEDPEKCVLGIAAVIPMQWKTQSATAFFEKVLRELDSKSVARVTLEEKDYIDWES
jgi:uncharacterized protein YlxP (DUF503 family)